MAEHNFIEEIVRNDIDAGRFTRPVMTRFAPEPGGHLHIAHARGVFASMGLAETFGGYFNIRLDDTDPAKDHSRYVDMVLDDIRLLGVEPGERVFFASDYFDRLFDYAVDLIRLSKAYVCDLNVEEMRRYRGDYYTAGTPSPYRERSVDENIELFTRMAEGEFADGAKSLRARIDYNHPNILMRDPVIYRILDVKHYRTGEKWKIYPRYDFSHCLCDYLEGVTHSLAGKEFVVHRELYDWFPKELGFREPPRQIEYGMMKIPHTILGKRHLRKLIASKAVSGWDDPRLFTLRGLVRRGVTADIIRKFIEQLGYAGTETHVEHGFFEHVCREVLNTSAQRRMVVLEPLKVVIVNYGTGESEELPAINNPENPAEGTRMVLFSGELYIERDDFMTDPPKKYYRLAPGREVRLRYGYFVTCVGYETDPETGEVVEVRVEYDPKTRGGDAPDSRKPKSTLHWVDANSAVEMEVRLLGPLTKDPDPVRTEEGDINTGVVDPESLVVVSAAKGEASLSTANVGDTYQFERLGYFTCDRDSAIEKLVFNRTVALRDKWAKIKARL